MTNRNIIQVAFFKGLLGLFFLLLLYFSVVILISGVDFAQSQFLKYWYFVVSLAIGFGIQVGLYSYLKSAIRQNVSAKVVATSGATSTAAMISCCSHYLTNILPILGIAGVATFVSQYQVRIFWVGLAFNLVGIIIMADRIIKFSKISSKMHKSP